jgi:para-nitrobenzyl esterase
VQAVGAATGRNGPSLVLDGLGALRGRFENDLMVFRGVPYAASPFGAERFAPPRPLGPWTDEHQALDFGPASPQAPRHAGDALFGGEDCLTLNVWAPREPGIGSGWPVMVWIPGGAFMRGYAGDRVYDGGAFARHGIVFISVNYRVGIDGFMQLRGAPANRGLLDQVCALKWVQKHIATFGGDPRRVTIAGGSAGAGSVACLLGMPDCTGLFNRVIMQSPSTSTQTLEEAERASLAIAELLGTAPTAEAMKCVPLERGVSVVSRLAEEPALRQALGMSARQYFPLRPVVDGDVLTQEPLDALSRNRTSPDLSKIDVLVGSNREEMRLYLLPNGTIDDARVDLPTQFAEAVGWSDRLESHYALESSAKRPGEVLCAMQTDYFYREPARHIAECAAAAGCNVYLYEFEWQSKLHGGRLGAAHGLEVPFVFDQLDSSAGREITGVGAPQSLAAEMHSAWVSFVLAGAPGWPRYTAWERAMMRFSEASACSVDDYVLPPQRTGSLQERPTARAISACRCTTE